MTPACRAACWAAYALLAAVGLGSPVIYWGTLNYLGPSTEYHDPYIEGAEKLPDGKYLAYVGDRVFVRYTVVRHRINGDCRLKLRRYGEDVGGPHAGRRRLLDSTELRFRGADELYHPRWPLRGLLLDHGDGVDPLLPPGVDQQEIALYVVARYYCNPLDYIFPRYLQGGIRPNETERVDLIVRRRRPRE